MRVALSVLAGLILGGLRWGQQAPAPLHKGGARKPPQVISSADPKMPEGGLRGYPPCGLVYLIVDERGDPVQVQMKKSTGAQRLDDALLTAVRSYKFKPATQDGKPVVVDLYIDACFERG